jgi:hypothetical protein
MGIRGDFKDLVKIVNEGGLEVVTEIGTTGSEGNTSATSGGEKKETQEERKTCKSYDSRGIRTTIQLDGDYVTMMSPEALGMPELWKRHRETLKEKLSVVERLRRLAWKSSGIIFLFSVWTLYTQYARSGGYPGFQLVPASVLGLIGVAISIIMLFLNRITWWLAKWYVQRRFSSLISVSAKG